LTDASVIAAFNVRLAEETEAIKLDPECVNIGVVAILSDPVKGLYYVAESQSLVVGQVMITYEWSDWRNGTIWWLQSVYVEPEYRRSGVFRTLFNHLVELAQTQPGVCGLRLYMHADNARARQAYQKLGMQQTKYEVFELAFGDNYPLG